MAFGWRLSGQPIAEAGLWIPRRPQPPKVYQPGTRRAYLGELIQIDGSDHRWFEDWSPRRDISQTGPRKSDEAVAISFRRLCPLSLVYASDAVASFFINDQPL